MKNSRLQTPSGADGFTVHPSLLPEGAVSEADPGSRGLRNRCLSSARAAGGV